MFKKICRVCEKEYEYETQEDLSKYFYIKKTRTGTYPLRKCKECERREHNEKYKEGKYNYREKNDLKTIDKYKQPVENTFTFL